MFEELLEVVEKKLDKSASTSSPSYESVIKLAARILIEDTKEHEEKSVSNANSAQDAFIKGNRDKWSIGFRKLHALREVCIQAGANFQKQVSLVPEYEGEELVGVFLKQHAHACRISGEIIYLLEGGYPAAALERWRTLFKVAVTCFILKKHGEQAVIDYVNQSNQGVLDEDSDLDLDTNLNENTNNDSENEWLWAFKYTGTLKFEKLREHVDLGNDSSVYEGAPFCREGKSKRSEMLSGQSKFGLSEPAYFTAISLAQITTALITAHVDDDIHYLDYSDSSVFIKVIDNYVEAVKTAFVDVESN